MLHTGHLREDTRTCLTSSRSTLTIHSLIRPLPGIILSMRYTSLHMTLVMRHPALTAVDMLVINPARADTPPTNLPNPQPAATTTTTQSRTHTTSKMLSHPTSSPNTPRCRIGETLKSTGRPLTR